MSWGEIIKNTSFNEFLNLFLALDDTKRFKYHNCKDSVLKHTIRMINIHLNLFKGEKYDLIYFAILFHDLEELFTGDIPTPIKTQEDKEEEKKILLMIYKKVQSLEEKEYSTIKQNVSKLLKLYEEHPNIREYIKLIDTYDAMMFCFYMIKTRSEISYLSPFLFYLHTNKPKSFISFYKSIISKNEFNIPSNIITNPILIEMDIYEDSFTNEEIENILQLEIDFLRSTNNKNANPLEEIKFEIENFEYKLKILMTNFERDSNYNVWRKIFEETNINKKELKNDLNYLKNNHL